VPESLVLHYYDYYYYYYYTYTLTSTRPRRRDNNNYCYYSSKLVYSCPAAAISIISATILHYLYYTTISALLATTTLYDTYTYIYIHIIFMYVITYIYIGENVPLNACNVFYVCDGKRFVILINAARPESDGCKVRHIMYI